jgi:acetamidase/formamidase
MDLPASGAGATIYLPVRRPGALLFMGDIHAAQGHGEIIGGAIETSGKIDCTIRLIENQSLPHLRMRCAKFLTAVASHDDLKTSVQLAYANLLDWLSIDLKMNLWDAYNLISQAGSLMMGNLLSAPYPVAARIPISLLPVDVNGWDQAWA